MPYKRKVNNIALGNTNEFFNKIKNEVKSLIKSEEFEFYELELFAVTDILLDETFLPKKKGVTDYKYYGAIRGDWINDSSKKISPKGEQWVLPLDPHIKRYPVIGENVVCVNYLGRTYYSTILNHQNNPNNNIMTGLVKKGNLGTAEPTITTTPTFNKPLPANPGDIVIQGRFGNSINIGSQDLVGSSIKLVAHGRENPTYDLEKDAASIYIQDGGNVKVKNPNSKLGSNIVTGRKIVLDADYIVINAKKQLKLQGADLVEVVGGNTEIKHNKGGKIFTGETEKAIDELRERVKTKLTDEFNETKKEFLEASVKTREAFNKGIQDLKDLDDKMKDAIQDIEKKVEMLRNTSFTLNATEFTKLNEKVVKLTKKLAETPPNDPVGIALVVTGLTEVLRSYATLDFINKDIVTIEQKK
jgi:polyhydroxyalkanoate synthesis regulator phasin